MSDDDNVINLDPARPCMSILHKHKLCQHRRIELNELSRTVSCRTCGVSMDAFDCLIRYARDHAWAYHKRLETERLIKAREAEFEEVERKLRNAKARLRRMST